MSKESNLNLLALSHGLWLGGAWIATVEFFELLKNVVDLRVLLCDSASYQHRRSLERIGVEYRTVPCAERLHFPVMRVESEEDLIRWADLVWITDVEYLAAPRVKAVKNVPVVAHLHSYSLICPTWLRTYGMKSVCLERCTASRAINCFGGTILELAKLGVMSKWKSAFPHLRPSSTRFSLSDLLWIRRHVRSAVDSIDGFIAVSKFVKFAHRRFLDNDSKPIRVVYNLVTLPLKYPTVTHRESRERGLNIVYASGPDPLKGPHLALMALKILAESRPNVRLKMVGCKGTWVEVFAKRSGVGKLVEFTGRLTFRELYSEMYRADVVVMPSVWPEPFGRIPVEANRFGTIAVVTKRGGLPETVIDGTTGYISRAEPESLAESIRLSAECKVQREEVVQKSVERINPLKNFEELVKFVSRLAHS